MSRFEEKRRLEEIELENATMDAQPGQPHLPTEVETLFNAALDVASAEREAYLASACGDDQRLRRRVEALLRAHEAHERFLPEQPGRPPAGVPSLQGFLAAQLNEQPGDRIGRYKLLQKLGEGGCGAVYMAEQEEPVRRKVALKVIKLGMDTKQVVARFEAERQALALMDHPNIAKVLDAGATEAGRPYFVMELVGGIKITDYCEQNQLTTRQRLGLFIAVCGAVQHAHQKGIIHRDIKPSNVLVATQDAVPVPKVIDFGIAKATQGRLTDETMFTAFEQFLGTPAYVSPEQAQVGGLDVDTRSDIYSLGVLLYELLTGKTPFDAKELLAAGLEAMRRTIQEKEPQTPSTRLKQARLVAGSSKSEILNQKSEVNKDLDWIVMKCLEKDRARRYETANGLASDIERHLNNEPVVARPPSKLYEFRKTVQRHKVGFVAAGAVIAALTLGLVASAWQTVRARQAEIRESRNRVQAQQNLYKSLLGEARATRMARLVGYRQRVFALLEQAKALDVPEKNLADLREEAAACLGDFVGLTPVNITEFNADIDSACLAPSGDLAAFALHDCSIQLRETASGKQSARLTYSSGKVLALCFNRASDQLYAVTGQAVTNRSPTVSGRQVIVWSRNANGVWSEPAVRTLPGATAALFSTDEGVFNVIVETSALNSTVVDTNSARLRLFNLSTGALVPGHELIAHPTSQDALRVSGNGKVLVVATRDGRDSTISLKFYEWSKGASPKTLPFPKDSVNFALSDEGEYVIVVSGEGGAVYTFPGLERIAQLKELLSGASPAFGAGKLALAKIHQNRIRLWHLARGETLAMLDDPDFARPRNFTPDGNLLLTTGSRHARLYRLSTPEKLDLAPHAASVPGVAFSPDGSRLASTAKDGSVRVSDGMTGGVLWKTNDLPDPGQCLSFSPNGKWLAVGTWEHYMVWVRDAQTGQPLVELGADSTRGLAVTGTLRTPYRSLTCSVQFSPDGHFLATAGSSTNGVRIYSLGGSGTGEPPGSVEATLFKMAPSGSGLVFAPDSRSLAFASNSDVPDGPATLLYWDFLRAERPRRVGPQVMGGVESCSFTPDSRYLLAIDGSGAVVTIDPWTGDTIASFEAWNPQPGQLVEATQFMALSQDGSKLAVSSNTRLGVVIREPKTGKVIYSLPEEAGTVYWLAWSPDSRRLAVSRDNGNIAIWDLAAVEQILRGLGLNR